MKLEFYGSEMSPYAQQVELLLGMKKADYSRTITPREYVMKGDYDQINPLRKIPSLVVDGISVVETPIIFDAVEQLIPEPRLLPEDPMDRAKALLLARIADIYIAAPSLNLFYAAFTNSPQVATFATGVIARGVAALEHYISEGPYAIGQTRTVADCALPPVLFHMTRTVPGRGQQGLPPLGQKTTAYFEKVAQDPDVATCLERMDACFKVTGGVPQ